MGKVGRSRRILQWGILFYWNPHVNNYFRSQPRRGPKLLLTWPAQTLGSPVPMRHCTRTHCVILTGAATDFTVSRSTDCWVSKTSWFQQLILTRDSPVKVENWRNIKLQWSITTYIKDFPHPSIQALRPTQLRVKRVSVVFRGGKAAMGVVLTTNSHLHTEIRERIELHLYSPFGPSRPVLGWNLWLYNSKWFKISSRNKVNVTFWCRITSILSVG
jgi:hypothetical protein